MALFGQLYISKQNRQGDLKEFFAHEVQSFPPSLSDFGKIYLPGSKSDMLSCIMCPDEDCSPPSAYDSTVLDGGVVVHMLTSKTVCTFDEYADQVFIPYLINQLQSSSRVDVVWDTCKADSLNPLTANGAFRRHN